MHLITRLAPAAGARRELHRASRQQHFGWLALCLAVGVSVVLYLALSLAVSSDPLLMPLDDTYIHFQYARQLAHGEPMVYNPGDPATSGGTSLVYPLVLAVGYVLGFTNWALAYWALALGVVAHLGTAGLVYQIARFNPLTDHHPERSVSDEYHVALLVALAYAVTGPFVWAALSGMETALFLFAVLLNLFALQREQLRLTLGAAVLATVMRPEGVIIAGISILTVTVRPPWPKTWSARFRRMALLAVPVIAALIQPVINVAVTGSTSSSGMRAKSHLYNTGAPFEQRVSDILEFFGRMWRELLTGRNPEQGQYMPVLLVWMALLALALGVVYAWRERRITLAVVMVAWFVPLTVSVATLDTAFWQFKRYQLPVMALFYPTGAWGAALVGERFVAQTGRRWMQWVIPVIIVFSSVLTLITFARNYLGNVAVVRDQQVAMARWVRDNLPEDARVGVHDVGLVRYFGDRALYDVVGLTTPGPAEAWRQGPGAIYETMASSDYRPDYFAIYPDVQGLRYLLDADVFGEILAEFPVDLPQNTVASAADYQAVYVADWSDTREEEMVAQTTTLEYLARLEGATLVDQVDVANLDSEAAHDYEWWQNEQPEGFITEVYRHRYYACALENEDDCWATDGGRVLTGGERFTIQTIPGQDVLLVTRVHGRESVPLEVYWAEHAWTTAVQPRLPGQWLEIVTLIPGEYIFSDTLRVSIRTLFGADTDGDLYMPYYHWAYQGDFVPAVIADPSMVARFDSNVTEFSSTSPFGLLSVEVVENLNALQVDLRWYPLWSHFLGSHRGDGVTFIHLYNRNDTHTEPVAQVVSRPAGGVLPPGNWLPGVIEDAYTLPLPDDLPPGEYVIAIGMFDAQTGERYSIMSDTLPVDDNRLFIGEITIEE